MAGRGPTGPRSTEYAWLITGPLALIAIVCTTAVGLVAPQPFGGWSLALPLLVAMVAAGIPVLNFTVRRQSLGVTLTEIPLVLAFYLVEPLTVVMIYTVASAVSHLRHRFGPTKFWFNVGRAAAGSSLAVLVLQALPPVEDVGPATWLKLFFAASMVNLLSMASVAGVHTLLQGWQAGRGAFRQSMPGLLAAMINIAIGIIVLILIAATWWSLLLLGRSSSRWPSSTGRTRSSSGSTAPSPTCTS